jgi:hypothetical protein
LFEEKGMKYNKYADDLQANHTISFPYSIVEKRKGHKDKRPYSRKVRTQVLYILCKKNTKTFSIAI